MVASEPSTMQCEFAAGSRADTFESQSTDMFAIERFASDVLAGGTPASLDVEPVG